MGRGEGGNLMEICIGILVTIIVPYALAFAVLNC